MAVIKDKKTGQAVGCELYQRVDVWFSEQGLNPDNFEVIYSDDEKEEIADTKKREGLSYSLGEQNYQVSFTSPDALAVMQVKAAFESGQERSVLKFANGTKLPITVQQFPEFAKWFAGKRNSFYQD